MWVLVAHVLWVSGYQPAVEPLLRLIGAGGYAVKLFIILSGFVITYLLDKRDETYLQFVVRRFFRLFPVFIVLAGVADRRHGNVQHIGALARHDPARRECVCLERD